MVKPAINLPSYNSGNGKGKVQIWGHKKPADIYIQYISDTNIHSILISMSN